MRLRHMEKILSIMNQEKATIFSGCYELVNNNDI